MTNDWAKRDRDAAKRAIKDMNAARNFPDGTCHASRHVAMMAETLAKGKKYHMLDSDREHCAGSMAVTVTALWRYRAKLAKAENALRAAEESIATFIGVHGYGRDGGAQDIVDEVSATLAELKEDE